MPARNDSPRSPALCEQMPNNPRLGIEIPSSIPEHMPQQKITFSTVAPDEDYDNFLRLNYRIDVEALDEWATVTIFIRGSIRVVVQEPDVIDDFKQFLITMYDSNWDKRVLSYQMMIIEQLYALITRYSKLTSRLKRALLAQFDSLTHSQVRAQIKGLPVSGGFLEIEKTFKYYCKWRRINLRQIYILFLLQCCIKVRWKLHKNKYFSKNLSHFK